LLKQAPPHYPAEAKYRRISGTAKMWVLINEVGKVEAVRSLGTADSLLQAASQEAVQQWSYSPATCNGEPVQYESVITINYDLRP
jgi:TonB family protein